MELLKKKCGSVSDDYEFRRLLNVICAEDHQYGHIPDYAVSFDGENVRFINRGSLKALPAADQPRFPLLDPETYHDARTLAPGWDVYHLEKEWHAFWYESGQPELRDPDAAFLGFCRSRHSRRPTP